MCLPDKPFDERLAVVLAQIERDKQSPPPVVLEGVCRFAERRRIDSEFIDPVGPL